MRYAASNTLTLPFGATIAQRMQRTDSRHFSRLSVDQLSRVDGEQVVFPDVTFRWSGQPVALTWLLSNVAATVRAVHTRQAFASPQQAGTLERRGQFAEALTALGYNASEITGVLQKLPLDGSTPTEDLVMAALRQLGR